MRNTAVTHPETRTLSPRILLGLLLACLATMTLATPASAGSKEDVKKYHSETGLHVVAVEEHWKVRVKYPDPLTGLPEFLFVLTPDGRFDRSHMVFAMNHHLYPSFDKGGVQLLAYTGERLEASQSQLSGRLLWETDDDIEVHFRMSIHNEALTYKVLKLKGKSWGELKENGLCKASVPTKLTCFDNYDAAKTHLFTGCANGVHTLEKVEVVKVRYEFSDGKQIDVDEFRTKIEYQPSVVYKTYEEYKATLEPYKGAYGN